MRMLGDLLVPAVLFATHCLCALGWRAFPINPPTTPNVSQAICNGGSPQNTSFYCEPGESLFCDNDVCRVLCLDNGCQGLNILCNATDAEPDTNTKCAVQCDDSCGNVTIESYTTKTEISCGHDSFPNGCKNVDVTVHGSESGPSEPTLVMTCDGQAACQDTQVFCSDTLHSCDVTCDGTSSCNGMEFVCNATERCSMSVTGSATCDNCRYFCPVIGNDVNSDDEECDCDDDSGSCNNVQQDIFYYYNTHAPTPMPSDISTEPSLSPSSVPTVSLEPTEMPAHIQTSMSAYNNVTIDPNDGAALNEKNDTNDGQDETMFDDDDDVQLSDIDAGIYNLVFSVLFLILLFVVIFELYKLHRTRFFEQHSPFSIIPMLVVICSYQFLVCLALGFSETYVSDPDVQAIAFILSVSVPMNFYVILVFMVAVSLYNKYPTAQRGPFTVLSASVECLSGICRVGSYYNFMLFIFLVVFILWALIALALAGDNESNLNFNSAMIVVYAVVGSYFGLTSMSAPMSYAQRHDISLGDLQSCCNPCYCRVLILERKIARNPRYVEEEGYSKERVDQILASKHFCCQGGCCTNLKHGCNVVTKEVLFGIFTGISMFFLCLFYIAIALGIGLVSCDIIRCMALVFEVLTVFWLLNLFPHIRHDSEMRLDEHQVLQEVDLPYTGHVRAAPSMDVVLHTHEKGAPKSKLSNQNMPYKTLKAHKQEVKANSISSDGDTAERNEAMNSSNSSNSSNSGNGSNSCCPCFGRRQGARSAQSQRNVENSIGIGTQQEQQMTRVDTDTEETAGAGSLTSPKLTHQAYSPQSSVSVRFDDTEARLFNVKNLERLQKEGTEYVEILDASCVKQSENRWNKARIKTIDLDGNRVEFEYVDEDGMALQKHGVLNLNLASECGKFRVCLFGHPEPWKLAIDEQFGVPKILVDLLAKMVSPDVDGQFVKGIFRKSANQTKLNKYKTAVCQYEMDSYDYTQAGDFKDQDDKNEAFDVHCIPALIKDWLRNFPESIAVFERNQQGLRPSQTMSKNDKIKEKLFEWITFLILMLSDPDNENEMTERSLAIVLAPNLVGRDLSPQQQAKMIKELGEIYEKHCIAKKNEENPIVEWMNKMYSNEETEDFANYVDDVDAVDAADAAADPVAAVDEADIEKKMEDIDDNNINNNNSNNINTNENVNSSPHGNGKETIEEEEEENAKNDVDDDTNGKYAIGTGGNSIIDDDEQKVGGHAIQRDEDDD